MKDLLSKVTVRDLEKMLEIKRREEKVAPLLQKRDELLRELAALDREIGRQLGRKEGLSAPAGEVEAAGPARRGRRALSDAARARIAAAQKARWAKAAPDAGTDAAAEQAVSDAAPASADAPAKKKRTLSPEARARIVAAQKARWAKAKGTKDTEAAKVAEPPPEETTPGAGTAEPETSAAPKPARKPRRKRAAEAAAAAPATEAPGEAAPADGA